MDYSQLTDAIRFSAVAPIVLGGGAALLTLYVLIKGVKVVIGLVRGGAGAAEYDAHWERREALEREWGYVDGAAASALYESDNRPMADPDRFREDTH